MIITIMMMMIMHVFKCLQSRHASLIQTKEKKIARLNCNKCFRSSMNKICNDDADDDKNAAPTRTKNYARLKKTLAMQMQQ